MHQDTEIDDTIPTLYKLGYTIPVIRKIKNTKLGLLQRKGALRGVLSLSAKTENLKEKSMRSFTHFDSSLSRRDISPFLMEEWFPSGTEETRTTKRKSTEQ